ncbi:hypothetical protein [Roseobacter ponti]|uniref:Lipoprotein n=1 Tax=Roseobacter ponti TaxID=1891787 RepID=A0A858STJ4_9RHOB|nr:hypothetical protein [Roseobacter ponti]QJF51278.1 hypothetical protein G3256_08945 [Roseobacter ponti]
MFGKICHRTATLALLCTASLALSGCLKAPGNAAIKAANENPTVLVADVDKSDPNVTVINSSGSLSNAISGINERKAVLPPETTEEEISLFNYATVGFDQQRALIKACEGRFANQIGGTRGCQFPATRAECKRSGWPSPCHLSDPYKSRLRCTAVFNVSIDSCVEGTIAQCKSSGQGNGGCFVRRGYTTSTTTPFGNLLNTGD